MVDPGLLRFLAEFLSLEEYGTAQRQLLRGVFDLEQMRALPLPQTEDDFVALVSDAHATLFKHVAGLTFVGGRYRCEHDPVSFGGDGRHEQEGAPHDKIEERLRQGFRVATAQGEGWDHISRSAKFPSPLLPRASLSGRKRACWSIHCRENLPRQWQVDPEVGYHRRSATRVHCRARRSAPAAPKAPSRVGSSPRELDPRPHRRRHWH